MRPGPTVRPGSCLAVALVAIAPGCAGYRAIVDRRGPDYPPLPVDAAIQVAGGTLVDLPEQDLDEAEHRACAGTSPTSRQHLASVRFEPTGSQGRLPPRRELIGLARSAARRLGGHLVELHAAAPLPPDGAAAGPVPTLRAEIYRADCGFGPDPEDTAPRPGPPDL